MRNAHVIFSTLTNAFAFPDTLNTPRDAFIRFHSWTIVNKHGNGFV
jgi:hypothetical protein